MRVKHISTYAPMHSTNNAFSSELPLTVRGIIRTARGTRTQQTYAAELGIRQDLLCKYEKGRVNPPVEIIERCMREVHQLQQRQTPSANAIAKRIRADLSTPEMEPIRATIANLLDTLSTSSRRMSNVP